MFLVAVCLALAMVAVALCVAVAVVVVDENQPWHHLIWKNFKLKSSGEFRLEMSQNQGRFGSNELDGCSTKMWTRRTKAKISNKATRQAKVFWPRTQEEEISPNGLSRVLLCRLEDMKL